MASIQVSHSAECEILRSSETGQPGRTFRSLEKSAGCTCGGVYYVFTRKGGKTHKEKIGKSAKAARRRLTQIQGQEDEGSYEPIHRKRFDDYADEWLDSLTLKPSTVDSYRVTMRLAVRVFGPKQVRALTVADVKRFDAVLEERGITPSTRAKHLRVLHKAIEDAIVHGYTSTNPVAKIPSGQRPKAERVEAAYFTREELVRLFGQTPEGVYRSLFVVAVKTGMRLGELLALRWSDVSLSERVIEIRRSYTGGRIGTPKSGKSRRIHISPDVEATLGEWWGMLGRPSDDTLVFPGQRGYLNEPRIRKVLYAAMEEAGIPRKGPSGAERGIHSFRHSFAKLALEGGRPLYWLSKHLGHSSYAVTDSRYGHWEDEEKRKQVDELAKTFAEALPGL
jgi:integrase